MRKLTKKALSLVLSVMLVVSAISCAFTVIAETVGTSTQPTRGWVVYDAPYSLDGSKGVSSWLGKVATTNTDDPYLVVADGVITSGEGATEGNSWHEAGPARFKIPNAVAGTKVTISFDFAVNLEGLSDEALEKVEVGERLLWPVFRQYNFADASTILEDIQQIFPSDDGKTIVSTEFTLSGPDDFFRIILRGCKTARYAWEVRNITVTVTHPNGTVEIYPSAQEGGNEDGNEVIEIPSYYGTNADGFNSKYSSWPQRLKPADSIDNLDFSKGFVYWSGRNANEDGNGTFASSSFKLVNSETNKYVTLRNEGYIDNMRTALFKVDGVEVGDKIVAIYFANGTDAENLRLVVLQDYIRNVTYDATTGLNTTATNASPGGETQLTVAETEPDEFQFQAEDTNWTTYIAPNSEVVVDPTTKSSTVVPTANIYLQVMITKANGVNAGDKLDVAIDNIILAKEVDGVYYDLATGEEITQETIDNMAPPSIDSTAGDDNQGGTTIPSYYGTESNGFTSAGASWPNKLKPADDIYNLDFSNGFIYWSGRNAGLYPDFTSTYASDSFKLVTEGDNKYITMRDEGYVDSMRSALFNASDYVAIGDELALVYDAKGADADKIRVTLQQDHLRGPQYVSYHPVTGLNITGNYASPGIPNVLVNNEAELTAITTADGWTTYVTSFTNAINDPATVPDPTANPCTADIYLQIIVKNGKGVEAGDQLDVAIDNIRIAKIQDGVYTDILTGDVLYTDLLYGKVAQIGDEYFETVEAAIAAAQENDTIKLIADVVIDETIKVTADKKITLDLNGFAIDGTEKVRIALMTYGDVTLKDSSAEQTGIIRAGIGTAGNAVNVCGGTFTMESGRIYSKNNALLIDEEACTVNINGGYIAADPVASNSAAIYVSSTSATSINITAGYLIGDNGILLWNNTELNITGGTIDASSGVGIQGNGSKDNTKINISGGSISGFEAAIYHPQGGELNISGTVTLTGSTGIVVKGGKVTISGGKIIATGDAVAYEPKGSGFVGTGDALYVEHYDNSSNSENYGTPVVSVTGGVFNSANANAIGSYANANNNVEALTGFVTGGTFDTVIDDACLAEGFALKDNAFGAFTVVEEYDLETGLYCVKGFKPAGSDETRYGFLMTIGIDSLNYNKDGCGFYLTVGNTTKKFVISNGTVWESLAVDLPTETVQLTPVDFGEGNQYIMHYTIYFTETQLEALGNEKVSVKGFVTTFEGEELVTKTFNCGTLA